jgi:hypothetical protein
MLSVHASWKAAPVMLRPFLRFAVRFGVKRGEAGVSTQHQPLRLGVSARRKSPGKTGLQSQEIQLPSASSLGTLVPALMASPVKFLYIFVTVVTVCGNGHPLRSRR